jgi:CIC family chloride channel protein
MCPDVDFRKGRCRLQGHYYAPAGIVTLAMHKFTRRGIEEIPLVDKAQPGKVLFMLSRRAVLTRYASEKEKEVIAET